MASAPHPAIGWPPEGMQPFSGRPGERLARAAYSLLAYCAVVPALAYLWWRGRKDPAYRKRWNERLAFGASPAPHLQGGVVLHCASVGEVIAARPLVAQLLADPRWGPLTLTCTTPTGSQQIVQAWGHQVAHCYLPLDLPGAGRRFLQAWRPRLVLLMERELWPVFLHQAQGLGVPVALVNARLSERSAAGYARWQRLMAPAIATLRLVCAEDDSAAARFAALGVSPQRLEVTGNVKSDLVLEPALLQRIAATRAALGTRPVLTAGSTHAGEDEALVQNFRAHLAQVPQTLLVLVPRHPERFETVAQLLAQAGLRTARLSRGERPGPDTQVVLGDTLGELLHWYGVSDACFVGGSLVPRGGHNPMEVLCHARPLIAGPHTANFEPMYSQLQQAGALLRAGDAAAVFQHFRMLLLDPSTARGLGRRGHAEYQRRGGASTRTLAWLATLTAPYDPGAVQPPAAARHGGQLVWTDARRFPEADPQLLDPHAWQQPPRSAAPLQGGRGNVHAVADRQHSYLLRHYYRGGLMARLSRDLFLLQAAARTRALREFQLLRELRQRGLAVPQPCAARRSRQWVLWYRADILVERIPDATDVGALLHRHRALDAPEWEMLGHAVRRLHDAQVYHSDLNCHNLMLDIRGKAWIVDFDKCGFRTGDAWKKDNLERLLRSLRKELRLDPGFRWTEDDWAPFLAGYGSPPLRLPSP